MINYPKQAYNAGLQNWDIRQDKTGIYLANNEGLLTFDGQSWAIFPLPNKTIVRSVETTGDGKIYVGGQDELGYFSPTQNGTLSYHSLTDLIAAGDRKFGDVWNIVVLKDAVYFRTPYKIFKLWRGKFTSVNALSEFSFLGSDNGKLYVHDNRYGLLEYRDDSLIPVATQNPFAINDPVTAILSITPDTALVATLKNGLYLLAPGGITKMVTPNNQLFGSDRIYAATTVNSTSIALATSNNGVYIINHKGDIIQSFSKKEGLQDNNVLSIFNDNQGNLWLGLNNGIDLIAYNNPIKQVVPLTDNGSGYASAIYHGKLFLGTTNGLFSVPLQPTQDLSFTKGTFSMVNNTKGQVWALSVLNDQLLLGHHEGAFVVDNNIAKPFSLHPGFWRFVQFADFAKQIVAGNYNGLEFFTEQNNQFVNAGKVKGFTESSRFVEIDSSGQIWVSHPYHGIYRIVKSNDDYKIFTYSGKRGLPSELNNHLYKLQGAIVAATSKGVYVYNKATDHFEASAYFKRYLGDEPIRYVKQDHEGNIWFIREKSIGVLDLSGKSPVVIDIPELNNKMLSGFENINPVDRYNIFIGGGKGFYHINYDKYKRSKNALDVKIRSVQIADNTDSVLFGGYYASAVDKLPNTKNYPAIDSRFSTIRFEFSSSLFGDQSNQEYSYRLKGFTENWSEWSKRTEKEYTNLGANTYTFEVKARNNLGSELPVTTYVFQVLAPWYLTWLAYFIYFVIAIVLAVIAYRALRQKFRRQRMKYEQEQQRLRYIHELELSKTESEMMVLRNEKLETEINYKNSELASSAMHLLKKGELISKVKSELTQLMRKLDNQEGVAELKKTIRNLCEDENMDEEWENFTHHFDKVHSDFVVQLKEKHPNITSSEIKLCAYLRMNLSAKEIAQLMNISVRGVETGRYRLRKKLQLPTEQTLFDYLVNI